jgi:outer membrane protein assembly factor BamB
MRAGAVVVLSETLEDVHPGSVTSGGEPDASLSFSADGRLLAVGTFGGRLRVFDTESCRCVFERRMPGAVVKRVAVSPDNARVYAGEMSYDGFVMAFDLVTKKELWRFRLADELRTSTPAKPDDFFAIYSYPQAYAMRAVHDDLIVDGFHSWNDAGRPRHLSRLYRFDGRTGRAVWRLPEDAPLSRNISWFDLDGSHLVFSAYQWEKPAAGDAEPQAAVGLVDLASGKLLDRQVFEPLAPFFDTVPMWYGLALDETGEAAVGLMDGRAAILRVRSAGDGGHPTLGVVRKMDLATPVEVTGVPIYAGVGWAASSGRMLFLLTDGRLVAPSASAQGKAARADHYNSNTLFVFDGPTGKLLWQWKLTTTAEGVAAGKGIVAVSTQQSYSSDDPMDYGVTVFDASAPGTPVEKMRYRYPTAGPIVALAVSPDGKTIAAVEAPVRLSDGMTVIGKYRLHILR